MKTWIAKLQDVYSNLEEFSHYSETYGLAARWGFASAAAAWAENPRIGGSTNPADSGPVTFETLDTFTRAYITAAFWTTDDDAPGGMDYRDTGRAEELFSKLADEAVLQAIRECAIFQREQETILAEAGDDEQNGHDFWLTRNHHGAGFWDRGYAKNIGEKLTAAAEKSGERDLYAGDDEQFYFFPGV